MRTILLGPIELPKRSDRARVTPRRGVDATEPPVNEHDTPGFRMRFDLFVRFSSGNAEPVQPEFI
jgi:hypothetical protein